MTVMSTFWWRKYWEVLSNLPRACNSKMIENPRYNAILSLEAHFEASRRVACLVWFFFFKVPCLSCTISLSTLLNSFIDHQVWKSTIGGENREDKKSGHTLWLSWTNNREVTDKHRLCFLLSGCAFYWQVVLLLFIVMFMLLLCTVIR